ncbi:MAG: metal ABC transporter permease [Hyphomicrobium sp.]
MTSVVDFFLNPLAYDFMQRGLVVALLVGTVCALLSSYLVLKGWSLMGDAISHAVFPGIVMANILGVPLPIGAFVAGLGCALLTGYVKSQSPIKEDAVMAIVFSALFGLGLVIFTRIETDQHLSHILFGDMLGVSWMDVLQVAIIALPTICAVFIKRKDLLLYCFDETYAKALGLNVRFLHFGLLTCLALTIVASIKAVGIILVVGMLVTPGAIGFLVSRSFGIMQVVAISVAVSACILGTLFSFYLDTASGPTIILVQAMFFGLALFLNRVRVWKKPHSASV